MFDSLYPDHIEGVIDPPVLTDADGTPNTVIEIDRDNTVDITWRLTTDDVALHPVQAIDGKWVIRLAFESFGSPIEFELPDETVLFSSGTLSADETTREWTHQFTIPANTAQEAVYKMATLITYRFPDDSRGAMAGYQEGPLVTFYQDV